MSVFYLEARARLSGSARPDLFTQVFNRIWIGKSFLS